MRNYVRCYATLGQIDENNPGNQQVTYSVNRRDDSSQKIYFRLSKRIFVSMLNASTFQSEQLWFFVEQLLNQIEQNDPPRNIDFIADTALAGFAVRQSPRGSK